MSDARKKQKRLERMLKVQAQKRQIEEWSLSHLKREREAIEQSARDILDSLDPTSDLHGLFTDAKVKTLRRNDVARQQNAEHQKAGEARLSEARRQEKGVERRFKEAGKEASSREEADALDGHIEGFLARLTNSLG